MPKKRILVVDDEESVRFSLTRVLEYSGYEVIVARDGVEGIAEIEREKRRWMRCIHRFCIMRCVSATLRP